MKLLLALAAAIAASTPQQQFDLACVMAAAKAFRTTGLRPLDITSI
jgi:hypothetical protein